VVRRVNLRGAPRLLFGTAFNHSATPPGNRADPSGAGFRLTLEMARPVIQSAYFSDVDANRAAGPGPLGSMLAALDPAL
jgi:hypothetical protein